MQKRIAVILILSVLLAVVMTIYFFSFTKNNDEVKKIFKKEQILSKCLNEDFDVSYKINEKETPLADVIVSVNDKSTKKELFFFKIENVRKNYHPIELQQCGVYVIREFNYNPKKTKQEPGYKTELWKYDYNGSGKPIVLFHEKIDENGIKTYKSYYGTDFRIDPYEKYLILEKWTLTEFDKGGYIDEKDLSIVIKDLNTKEDIFAFSASSIFKQYPNIVGNFNMRDWSKDGRYFWGDIFDGAYVLAYFRIDTQNWKADIYEAPDGAMGGFPLNINTGYVPIQPGQVWTGDYQLTEELKEKDRKEGKKSSLYLYNLFSKEKIHIETSNEPLFYFEPKWLSDTELEYILPTGEKKIYVIDRKR